MKVIKEDIENLERYIGNSKVDVHAELPLVMADAYSASKKAQEEIDKELKPEKLDIEDEKVIGAEKQPVPKKPEEAKINLEESLFEDIFYPHRSADILTDMIDDGQFDYQDKMEKLVKDLIYLVDDRELSEYLKKKGIYSEALREEFLSEDYRDKNWKLVELIQDYIRQGHIDKDEFIDKILQWYYMEPTFNSFLISNNIFSEDEMDELIEYHESLEEAKSLQDIRVENAKKYLQKAVDALDTYIERKDESLKEGRKASPFIDSEGNEYSDEDRSEEDMDDSFNNLWTIVYNEIAPENPNWKLKTKFPDIPTWKRYDQDHLEFDYDDNIIIHAEKEEDFDLAKRIADEYGLEFRGPKQRKFDKDFIATIVMPKVD